MVCMQPMEAFVVFDMLILLGFIGGALLASHIYRKG